MLGRSSIHSPCGIWKLHPSSDSFSRSPSCQLDVSAREAGHGERERRFSVVKVCSDALSGTLHRLMRLTVCVPRAGRPHLMSHCRLTKMTLRASSCRVSPGRACAARSLASSFPSTVSAAALMHRPPSPRLPHRFRGSQAPLTQRTCLACHASRPFRRQVRFLWDGLCHNPQSGGP